MALVVAIASGALFATASYLMLRRSGVKVLIGLTLLGHAANLAVFGAAGPRHRRPPILPEGSSSLEAVADPLPQALILTAIVITFAIVVFAAVLMKRTHDVGDAHDLDEMKEPEA